MRATAKAFSFFMVGALAFISLLTPIDVNAQAVDLTINVSSSNPDVASVMAPGSTWSVTDGENTMDGVFAEGDLVLPATIGVNNPVPTGTYYVTVNAGPDFQAYEGVEFTIDETTTSIDVVLTPIIPDPEPETAIVEAAAYICDGMTEPGLLSEVGPDCVGTSTTFDFYLIGDGSGDPNYTLPVDTSGSLEVVVGDYEVYAANGTAFTLNVPAEGTSFAYGYPGEAPVETGVVSAAAYACEGMTAPGLLDEVGPDCTPTSATFDFYLVGDNSGAPNYTLPVDGSGSIEVLVGDYEVFASDGTTFALSVPVDGTSFAYGYPTDVSSPTATVNAAAYECEGMTAPGLLGEVGPDCVATSTTFDFYLVGDNSGEPNYTLSVDGSGSIEVLVGEYEVFAANGTTFDLIVTADGASFAYGYPSEPAGETGTVTANVWHCLALETPGPLPVVGDDCIPGPAAFDFYLIGDGTDDAVRMIVDESGTNTITLPVGEYEVYEVSTDTRVNNVLVTADANSVFTFGIPRTEAPPDETGILSVSTYVCEDLSEPVVLGEIGPDCTRVSTNLSFYLWGDGTDFNWPLTTSATGPVDHELPIGSYEVIDEWTQSRFSATVTSEGSAIAFGIPASVVPGDPPADPPADDPPVTKLPETGTGTSNSVGSIGLLLSGAILAAGALGVKIRKVT